MKTFARNGNPAFTPEMRQHADNCWISFTELNALCVSHMGIENFNNWFPEGPYARTVSLLGQLSGAIAEAQGKKDSIKLIKLGAGQNPGKVEMGDYRFDFTSTVRPQAGEAAAAAPARPAGAAPRHAATDQDHCFLDNPFLLIVNTAPDEYYFATNGNFRFRVYTKVPGANIAAAASIDRGYFKDNQWVLLQRLNGDDIEPTGNMSSAVAQHWSGTIIPLGSHGRWNVPFAPPGGTSPAPTVWRIIFYQYH